MRRCHADFFNKIGAERTHARRSLMSAYGGIVLQNSTALLIWLVLEPLFRSPIWGAVVSRHRADA
jgi:hypothetical protein